VELARLSETGRALELLQEAKAIAPEDVLVASELGTLKLRLNLPSDALTELTRVLAARPRDPHAAAQRGEALLALKFPGPAAEDFERALNLDRCQFEAHRGLKRLNANHYVPTNCGYSTRQLRELKGER
jgi:predicted Zn-dependent protease